ncbi:pimeloyl-ACP methyl ester carboxylesterase [Arthrobacter sp. PvP023]|uniref:alpha/beta fold hydrolase n=1 Tax=Micrococcaceae TaxID=1268 RepID=UPI001AEAF808|nr:alpha/beta hydrolase [Arthrobacter sp. PvP023]MBP1137685.1 pimeloyl-ACP methyl ester carboxylesterase [Arthrobacter sp. PvP023]
MIAQILGEGQPLVVIHGFGVDHRIMLPLEDALDGSGWQRIYIDLPWAAGNADVDVSSADQIAQGVLDDIREYLGDRSFAVIGNSFGGMIARHVAHELRDRVLGLATLAGVFEPAHEARCLPRRQVVREDPSILAMAGEVRDDYEEMTVVQTEATLNAFIRYALPGLRTANQTVLDRVAAEYALSVEPEVAHPAPVEAPSLHLFGRQDHVTGYEDGWKRRNHYVRGTYAVLDAAGHNAHLERPDLTAALVRDWLIRTSASAL